MPSLWDDTDKRLKWALIWSVNEAKNVLQRESMLHIVASTINKRITGTSRRDLSFTTMALTVTCGVADVGPFVDEGLPGFWEEYVKNNEVPVATRKNALTAWLWVRILLQ